MQRTAKYSASAPMNSWSLCRRLAVRRWWHWRKSWPMQCRRMAWTNHRSCSRSPSVSAWHGIPDWRRMHRIFFKKLSVQLFMQSKTARTGSRYMKEILTRSAGIKGPDMNRWRLRCMHWWQPSMRRIPLPSSILPMYHSMRCCWHRSWDCREMISRR